VNVCVLGEQGIGILYEYVRSDTIDIAIDLPVFDKWQADTI